MDKAKAAAQQVENAQVESVTDANGLQAVKVTFDSGILFNTSSSALSSNATASLAKFASTVLNVNKDMDVAIKGYTDNQGWKNSTAAQSVQKNMDLSLQRANSVSNYLKQCGVSPTQITSVEGLGEADPVADNSTAAGREQNRRVEVYLYASEKMIQEAQAQAGN
jgi:outer membrane protein OmpA-like peptidoglycan-associated protein